jgi:glucose-1-phosphate thymidylyltransferase
VVLGDGDRVREVQVKSAQPSTPWIWGAFKAPVAVLTELQRLWEARQHQDQYIGTLVNHYLAAGGEARGVKAGVSYVDVGTLHGYREALKLLHGPLGPQRGEISDERAK